MAHVAVVACTDQSSTRLLGLELGERVLLSLAYGGVDRVAFVGDGPRPVCPRADLEVVEVADLAAEDGVFVVPADAVFDRQLLSTPEGLPADGALAWMPPSDAQALAADMPALLARLGPGVADGGRGFALRVTNRDSWKRAHRALLVSLRKPIDGFVSRNLNRHVSTFISSYLVRTGIPPNYFTFVFLLVGVAGAFFAAMGEPWWALVLGGFLFQAQSILDGCDGEIARLTYRFSYTGQWLDSIGDDLTNYLFCLGLAIGQARVTGQDWLYVLGVATLVAQVIASGVLYHRMFRWKTGDMLAIPDLMTKDSGGEPGPVLGFLRALTKRDVFVLIVATVTALQLPIVAFLAYSVGTFPVCVFTVLNDRKVAKLDPAEYGH